MKRFNKVLRCFLVSFLILVMVSGNIFNLKAKADTNIPKFLNYNDGYAWKGEVYKSKALFQINKNLNDYGTYYFSNGEKERFVNSIDTVFDQNKLIINSYNEKNQSSSAIFDFRQGTTTEPYDLNELNNILESKYNKKNMDIGRLTVAGNQKGMWYEYCVLEGDSRIEGVVTPEKNVLELEKSQYIATYTVSDDRFFGIIDKIPDDKSEVSNSLKIIDTDGTIKELKIDESLSRYYVINYLKVSKNKIYAHLESNLRYDYAEKNVDGYYELVERDGKLYKGEELLKNTKVLLINDYEGYMWYVKDGAVYKFENSQWVKKFEVDRRMNEINVYDDNNFLVTAPKEIEIDNPANQGNQSTYYMTGIHTMVLDGKCLTMDNEGTSQPDIPQEPTAPTSPTTGSAEGGNNGENNSSVGNSGSNSNSATNENTNNSSGTNSGQSAQAQNNGITTPSQTNNTTEKVIINPIKNYVLPVEVNKIDKDASNVIDVSNATNAKKLQVIVADTKSIKEGNGSLQVKLRQDSSINIPFSVIDKSLLSDTSKLVLDTSVEDNTDVVKGLKAVNKLYSFDLTVVDGDKKTAVHKFANGSAEITLNLSDEELKGLDKNNLAVFYYNEETKKFELMETKVDGNKINFKTPHFSKFIIAEKTIISTDSSNGTSVLPKTGSSIGSHSLTVIGVLFIILGTITLCVKRYGKLKGTN